MGVPKVMSLHMYLMQAVWPWNCTCPNLFTVGPASVCHAEWLAKCGGGMCCIPFKMGEKKKLYQCASTAQLLLSSDPWKWTSHQNSLAVIGFLWWRYCGHKYCTSAGKNIERLWQKCGPAAFWKACHSNSLCEQAKVDEHIKKKKK